MRILIAGAEGQLGRSLQRALSSHQIEACEHKRLDIASLEDVRSAVEAIRPEIVINAAAWNNVDGAETDSTGAYRVNALGPRNLAIATAARGIALVHVSTDYVFDGESEDAYHEYHPTNPLSVYGKSKLAGEEAVRSLNERHYIVRTALLYHEDGSNFPNRMLEQRDRTEVRAVEDQFGSPTYAPHLAQGISRFIGSGAYGTYHLAGRGGASILEWTRTLYRFMNINITIVPVSMATFRRPAARPRHAILTTIQQPEILLPPWEDGLAEFARHK
jgi:dTDP-4-dehydrorhamnose reductase